MKHLKFKVHLAESSSFLFANLLEHFFATRFEDCKRQWRISSLWGQSKADEDKPNFRKFWQTNLESKLDEYFFVFVSALWKVSILFLLYVVLACTWRHKNAGSYSHAKDDQDDWQTSWFHWEEWSKGCAVKLSKERRWNQNKPSIKLWARLWGKNCVILLQFRIFYWWCKKYQSTKSNL